MTEAKIDVISEPERGKEPIDVAVVRLENLMRRAEGPKWWLREQQAEHNELLIRREKPELLAADERLLPIPSSIVHRAIYRNLAMKDNSLLHSLIMVCNKEGLGRFNAEEPRKIVLARKFLEMATEDTKGKLELQARSVSTLSGPARMAPIEPGLKEGETVEDWMFRNPESLRLILETKEEGTLFYPAKSDETHPPVDLFLVISQKELEGKEDYLFRSL